MNLTIDTIAAYYSDIIAADKAADPRVTYGDYIRIARIHALTSEHPQDITAALIDLYKDGHVDLSPESNTKVLTNADHAAAVAWGSEPLHLVAFLD
jgi:hypothetical protein